MLRRCFFVFSCFFGSNGIDYSDGGGSNTVGTRDRSDDDLAAPHERSLLEQRSARPSAGVLSVTKRRPNTEPDYS